MEVTPGASFSTTLWRCLLDMRKARAPLRVTLKRFHAPMPTYVGLLEGVLGDIEVNAAALAAGRVIGSVLERIGPTLAVLQRNSAIQLIWRDENAVQDRKMFQPSGQRRPPAAAEFLRGTAPVGGATAAAPDHYEAKHETCQ